VVGTEYICALVLCCIYTKCILSTRGDSQDEKEQLQQQMAPQSFAFSCGPTNGSYDVKPNVSAGTIVECRLNPLVSTNVGLS